VSNRTDLPEEAQNAWLAYQAMSESKKTYFTLLQELDMKYKKRGSPTLAENLRLEELLKFTAVPLTFTPTPTDELRAVYRGVGHLVIK